MSTDSSTPSRRGTPRLRKLLKELHHQTWELELLISGLVTFALFQTPGPVDQAFRYLRVELAEGAAFLVILVFAYVKLAIYALTFSFLFHLVVRAFWVALVGLDSVFPRGVRPARLTAGPLAKQYMEEELPPVRRLISLTDDVASVVFAAAFSLVAVFLFSIPSFGGILVLAYGAAALLPGEVEAMRVFWAVWGAFIILAVLPTLLDRTMGDRLRPGSLPRRLIRKGLGAFYFLTGYRIYGPIQLTLASNFGSRTATIATTLVVMLLGGVYMVRDILVGTGNLVVAGSPFIPSTAGESYLDPNLYDDQRDPRTGRQILPSIESQVVTGPFLRLFIPYRPAVSDPRMEAICPGVEPAGSAGLRHLRSPRADSAGMAAARRDAASLACAAGLWRVSLNGDPLEVEPVFARHPDSRLSGLQYMIPTRGLEEGRQVLTVADVPVAADGEEPGAPREFRILFWWGSER